VTVSPHLIVMAAGTGGHIIPGLAVAREMQSRGWSVSWLGTPYGLENRLVPPTGIALDVTSFSGLRGKGLWHSVSGAWHFLGALWRCQKVFRARHVTAVLGMGGYVCVPGGLIAALLRKPLMLVNADAGLLLSNRALLRWADAVAFGFDGPQVSATPHAQVTGNPVRAEVENLPEPEARFAQRQGALKVLVVGGSLGAQVLNDTLPQALALIPLAQRPQVTHQTGDKHCEKVRAAYAQAGVTAQIVPFIHDMAKELAECDVMVCRAGAITVSELCAAGVASVLVPLMVSTTSHQRENALWMERHGAAVHVPQAKLNAKELAQVLSSFTREQLLAMAQKARALSKPQAAARVADVLEHISRKTA
jgi:UDP-N-acetylglucosamine--N-acetylmuramyl-(pentapeptide) pyrophosphoryl-undecaprenol N-acetylglucosamine transferase